MESSPETTSREDAPPLVALERTQLSLEDGVLVKRHSARTVGRHSLDTVESLEVTSRIDPFAVFFTVLVAGLAVAAKVLVPNPAWSLFGAILLSIGALLLLTGIRSTALRIRTKHGEVSYATVDPPDQVEGFVLTLREEIARRRAHLP